MTGAQRNHGFRVLDEPLPGLLVLQRSYFTDRRGRLERIFAAEDSVLKAGGVFAQHVNLVTLNEVGTLKGMHVQRGESPENKLLTCIAGVIFDACVDLRPESSTFGRWFGITLDAATAISILVPAGFGHGVQCLEERSSMIYVHSDRYRSDSEYGVQALDPAIGIDWPLPAKFMSQRDRELPCLQDMRERTDEV